MPKKKGTKKKDLSSPSKQSFKNKDRASQSKESLSSKNKQVIPVIWIEKDVSEAIKKPVTADMVKKSYKKTDEKGPQPCPRPPANSPEPLKEDDDEKKTTIDREGVIQNLKERHEACLSKTTPLYVPDRGGMEGNVTWVERVEDSYETQQGLAMLQHIRHRRERSHRCRCSFIYGRRFCMCKTGDLWRRPLAFLSEKKMPAVKSGTQKQAQGHKKLLRSMTAPETRIAYEKKESQDRRKSSGIEDETEEKRKSFQGRRISGDGDRAEKFSWRESRKSFGMQPLPTLQFGSEPILKSLGLKPAHTLRVARVRSTDKEHCQRTAGRTMTVYFDENMALGAFKRQRHQRLSQLYYHSDSLAARKKKDSAAARRRSTKTGEEVSSETESETTSESTISDGYAAWREEDAALFMDDNFDSTVENFDYSDKSRKVHSEQGKKTVPSEVPSSEEGDIAKTSTSGPKPVRPRARSSVKSSITDPVKGPIKGRVWRSVKGSVMGSVRGSIKGSVRGSVEATVRGSVEATVRGSVEATVTPTFTATITATEYSVEHAAQTSVPASVQPIRSSITTSIPSTVDAAVKHPPVQAAVDSEVESPSLEPPVKSSRYQMEASVQPAGKRSVISSAHPSAISIRPSATSSVRFSLVSSIYPSATSTSVSSSSYRSSHPSVRPSSHVSIRPSSYPLVRPLSQISVRPSSHVSARPSSQISATPSFQPSVTPSPHPSARHSSEVAPSAPFYVEPSAEPSDKTAGQPSDQSLPRSPIPMTYTANIRGRKVQPIFRATKRVSSPKPQDESPRSSSDVSGVGFFSGASFGEDKMDKFQDRLTDRSLDRLTDELARADWGWGARPQDFESQTKLLSSEKSDKSLAKTRGRSLSSAVSTSAKGTQGDDDSESQDPMQDAFSATEYAMHRPRTLSQLPNLSSYTTPSQSQKKLFSPFTQGESSPSEESHSSEKPVTSERPSMPMAADLYALAGTKGEVQEVPSGPGLGESVSHDFLTPTWRTQQRKQSSAKPSSQQRSTVDDDDEWFQSPDTSSDSKKFSLAKALTEEKMGIKIQAAAILGGGPLTESQINYFHKFLLGKRNMTTFDKHFADVLIRKIYFHIKDIEKFCGVVPGARRMRHMLITKLRILQDLLDEQMTEELYARKRAQEDDFDEASDPTTMMGPGEACTSAAKTSKKKKKMTKEEKAIAALEKQCEKMLQDSSVMMRFLDRMIVWFAKNSALVTKLFQMVDQSGDGIINQKTFKAGMFDLNCPTNMTELHMLTKLLDPDSKDEIKYNEINDYLNKALNSRHKAMHKEAEARQLILSERICVPCPKCAMSRCEPGYKEKFPKFANLEMRMITFDKFPKYPGHFNKVVTTNLPVCGLIEIIVQETKTASTKINIFWDKSRTARARLNPDLTLEECGIQGGAKHLPEQVTLYYDYITEFDDCALLLCDHYFGQKITIT